MRLIFLFELECKVLFYFLDFEDNEKYFFLNWFFSVLYWIYFWVYLIFDLIEKVVDIDKVGDG